MTLTPESPLLVSIVINNYNYGRFIGAAIDSALAQTYPHTEIIVVDDGSSDNSRDVIERYGDRVTAIFKPNGGQASAFNAGFQASRGDVICFLDSDDIFHPRKVETCLQVMREKLKTNPRVMVYHRLEMVDKDGNSLHRYDPPELWNYAPNLYEHACKYRDIPFHGAPTSGNMFSRALAERVFPMPEQKIRVCADSVVVRAMSLLGDVYGIDEPLGLYRLHGKNHYMSDAKTSTLPSRENIPAPEFIHSRDEFLNAKLQDDGKQPVISYYESMGAKYYFQSQGTYDKVFKLAIAVIQWRVSLETIHFFVKAAFQYLLWLINPSLVKMKKGWY